MSLVHAAEKKFLLDFVERVHAAANGTPEIMQLAVTNMNILQVRVLVQAPSDSIKRQIRLNIKNAGRTYHFEIDGRYRHGDDLGPIMVAFKDSHNLPREEFGWHDMFKEVLAMVDVKATLNRLRRP